MWTAKIESAIVSAEEAGQVEIVRLLRAREASEGPDLNLTRSVIGSVP